MHDELSVSFVNAANARPGHQHAGVTHGCGTEGVGFRFGIGERSCRKSEPSRVPFESSEVERGESVSRRFLQKILVFQTRSPEKIPDFPGAPDGCTEFPTPAASRRDAPQVAELIRFRQAESFVTESDERFRRLRGKGT